MRKISKKMRWGACATIDFVVYSIKCFSYESHAGRINTGHPYAATDKAHRPIVFLGQSDSYRSRKGTQAVQGG